MIDKVGLLSVLEPSSILGYLQPHETEDNCINPVFMNKRLHRIALVKVEHFGSLGDRDESGMPGWVSKLVCTGCEKEFEIDEVKSYFVPD